jgi:hypothetical protein
MILQILVMFSKNHRDEWSFNQAYHAWNKPLSQEEKSEAISLLTYAIEIDISNRVPGSEPVISEFAF